MVYCGNSCYIEETNCYLVGISCFILDQIIEWKKIPSGNAQSTCQVHKMDCFCPLGPLLYNYIHICRRIDRGEPTYKVSGPCANTFYNYWPDSIFGLNVTTTLTFDPVNQNTLWADGHRNRQGWKRNIDRGSIWPNFQYCCPVGLSY